MSIPPLRTSTTTSTTTTTPSPTTTVLPTEVTDPQTTFVFTDEVVEGTSNYVSEEATDFLPTTRENEGEDALKLGLIIGLPLLIIAITAVVIAILLLFYIRRRNGKDEESDSGDQRNSQPPTAGEIDDIERSMRLEESQRSGNTYHDATFSSNQAKTLERERKPSRDIKVSYNTSVPSVLLDDETVIDQHPDLQLRVSVPPPIVRRKNNQEPTQYENLANIEPPIPHHQVKRNVHGYVNLPEHNQRGKFNHGFVENPSTDTRSNSIQSYMDMQKLVQSPRQMCTTNIDSEDVSIDCDKNSDPDYENKEAIEAMAEEQQIYSAPKSNRPVVQIDEEPHYQNHQFLSKDTKKTVLPPKLSPATRTRKFVPERPSSINNEFEELNRYS